MDRTIRMNDAIGVVEGRLFFHRAAQVVLAHLPVIGMHYALHIVQRAAELGVRNAEKLRVIAEPFDRICGRGPPPVAQPGGFQGQFKALFSFAQFVLDPPTLCNVLHHREKELLSLALHNRPGKQSRQQRAVLAPDTHLIMRHLALDLKAFGSGFVFQRLDDKP